MQSCVWLWGDPFDDFVAIPVEEMVPVEGERGRWDQVGKCVLIQNSKEGMASFEKNRLQGANRGDGTGIGCFIKTFHDPEISFHASQNLAEVDFGGIPRKGVPARPASLGADEAVAAEVEHDLD
jgi:hypothetical protein